MQYMIGSILDYQDELMASQFIIENPNANGTCGCGSSFNIN
jgi:iron-sulfur cluster insertion protein